MILPCLCQAPLEPLQHNLESQTYEVFERDGTKYRVYEEAIFRALKDWPTVLGHEHQPIVVMVVGAGGLRFTECSSQCRLVFDLLTVHCQLGVSILQ